MVVINRAPLRRETITDILLEAVPKEDTLVPHRHHHISPAVQLKVVTIPSSNIISRQVSHHMLRHNPQHNPMVNNHPMADKLSNPTGLHRIHNNNTMQQTKVHNNHPSNPMAGRRIHKQVTVLRQPDNLNTEHPSPLMELLLIASSHSLHHLVLNSLLTALLPTYNSRHISPSNNRPSEVFSIKIHMAVRHTNINIHQPRTMEPLHRMVAGTYLNHSTTTSKACTMPNIPEVYMATVLHPYLLVAILAKTLLQEVIMHHHQVIMVDNNGGNWIMA